MIWFILIWALLLAFKLRWDYRAKYVDKRIIDHKKSALIDGSIYTLAAFTIFFWINGEAHKVVFGWLILAVGSRWLFFDLIWNKINKDPWDHYGTSSDLDRLLTDLGSFHLVPKIILIVTGLLLILL